jgi:hypothetical protein
VNQNTKRLLHAQRLAGVSTHEAANRFFDPEQIQVMLDYRMRADGEFSVNNIFAKSRLSEHFYLSFLYH